MVSGNDPAWRRAPVTLAFAATDAGGSGVDFTETALDAGGWTPLSSPPGTLEIAGQGVHTILFRSTDKAGNVEPTQTCTVRIDAGGPVTTARAARVRRGARVRLRYRVDDLTPRASVRIVVKTRAGRPRATLRLGLRTTNALQTASWRCRLPRGAYRIVVYAVDQAGNRQVRAGTARLSVL
jgi:hypothetical protein